MATPRRIMIFLLELLLYNALLSSKRGLSVQGTQTTAVLASPTYHNVHIASLLPSATCNSTPKGDDKRASLEVIHKHGPCSKLRQVEATAPSNLQRLEQDESRVASIRSRLANNTVDGGNLKDTKTTLPANSGMIFGTGDYFVTAGLGTPKRNVNFLFDTGSGLTWTQCQACKGHSYEKQEPIFNPSLSTSYANISCNSSSCEKLKSATGNPPECSASSTCVYDIQYGDQSESSGFLAKDKLTLASTAVFDDFRFGCSQNSRCTIPGGVGLLGLGRDEISFVSQTAETYGKVFSYCLPSISSLTGYLSFGSRGGTSAEVKYTPSRINPRKPSFYFLDLIAISVAGVRFPNIEAKYPTAGTIIDSGTVITRLPLTTYTLMREIFRGFMKDYPTTSSASILDTCYDFSMYERVQVPKISLFFSDVSESGDIEMELDPSGILLVLNRSQVCLAFAGNRDINDIAILGNMQQKTFKVVYDVPGERVGFGQGGCQ